MKARFADTSYFIALLSTADELHARALSLSAESPAIVTTDFVLLELLDGMAEPPARTAAAAFVAELPDMGVTVVPLSGKLLRAGMDLYRRRRDKSWSLTDCTSFVIMQQRKLREALTADHHFLQAGFEILMR